MIAVEVVGRRTRGDRVFETLRLRADAARLTAYLCLEHGAATAFGGIRLAAYPDEAAARAEAEALAAQMSAKLRLAELPHPGAKAVMMAHADLDRAGAFAAMGRLAARLDGRWVCGPDLGVGPDDLDLVRAETRFCNDVANDPGRSTARGVRAALLGGARVLGLGEPAGLRVDVQGLGSVGLALASMLSEDGARVRGFDLDAGRVAAAAARGLEAGCGTGLAPDAGAAAVLAPCAAGGVLDRELLPRLAGRFVCGSANRQRAAGIGAAELAAAGVVWAPDVLVGGGAVIEGVLVHEGRRDEVEPALDAIGVRTADVLREALRRGRTPLEVVEERMNG